MDLLRFSLDKIPQKYQVTTLVYPTDYENPTVIGSENEEVDKN